MKQTLARIAKRADSFCARINDGLAAVAIALALLTTAVLLERLPSLLPQPTQITSPETTSEMP